MRDQPQRISVGVLIAGFYAWVLCFQVLDPGASNTLPEGAGVLRLSAPTIRKEVPTAPQEVIERAVVRPQPVSKPAPEERLDPLPPLPPAGQLSPLEEELVILDRLQAIAEDILRDDPPPPLADGL